MPPVQPQAVSEPAPIAWPQPRRVIALSRAVPSPFDLTADSDARAEIAKSLGIVGIDVLRFRGELVPTGSRDWRIEGRLTADVVQHCVVTLDPVPEKIDEAVVRIYLDDFSGGIDLDPDSETDPEELRDVIDLGAVAVEELALSLDPFPHAEGVEQVDLRATPPGAAVLDEDAVKPFAGLAELRDKLRDEQS